MTYFKCYSIKIEFKYILSAYAQVKNHKKKHVKVVPSDFIPWTA